MDECAVNNGPAHDQVPDSNVDIITESNGRMMIREGLEQLAD